MAEALVTRRADRGPGGRSVLGRRWTGLAASVAVVLEAALAMATGGPALGAEAAAAKRPPTAATAVAATPAPTPGPTPTPTPTTASAAVTSAPAATPSAASDTKGSGPKPGSEKPPAAPGAAAKSRADVAKRLTAVRKATDRSNAGGAVVDGP